jgi:hypothetical protein
MRRGNVGLADLQLPPFAPIFGQVADKWVLKSVLGASSQVEFGLPLWWAHGSSCLCLIGRKGVALDSEYVSLLLRCVQWTYIQILTNTYGVC